MKHRDFKPCAGCGKGVAHSNQLAFFRLRIQRLVIAVGAVQRAHGLELMLGSPALANAMGPDEDLAKPIAEPMEILVCQNCAFHTPLAVLEEYANRADDREGEVPGA